jgi:thioester reductase-like protein
MEGDLNLPNFGLNKADETILINKCHIVFHCAATIRFNEPLKYI